MSYKSKYVRGLCCWFGCKERATIRYATPGHNKRENEEQLFCGAHWAEVTSIPFHQVDQMRVFCLLVHGPVDEK